MFETKAEIRRAARARVWEEGRQEGQQETRRELSEMLRRHVVPDAATGRVTLELTPEIAALLNPSDSEPPGAGRPS